MSDYKGEELVFPHGSFALGRSISIIHRFSQKFIDTELKEYKLTKAQMEVMIVTYKEEDPVNQTRVNELFGYNKATISKLVNSLEKEGYIKRCQSQIDKRENLIELTEHGYKVMEVIVGVLHKEESIFEGILGKDNDILVRNQLMSLAEKLKDYTL